MVKTLKDMKKAVLKKSRDIGTGKVEGYDFEGEFNPKKFFDSFKNTGFSATELGKAIEIVKKMQKEKARIFLDFTSNMGSCGVRDIITYLTKNKKVFFLVTTTGAIEEDIIKTHKDFLHGDYNADALQYLSIHGGITYCNKEGDKVVGVCRVVNHPDKNQLQAIYVLPEYQGRGVGRMLWEEAQKYFDIEKDTIVHVADYNEKAIGFYKKVGFVDTGKRFSEERYKMKSGAIISEMEMVIKIRK
jgi:ribosomal protein S18 acetylase RimI-like enzyme